MFRRTLLSAIVLAAGIMLWSSQAVEAQQGFGRSYSQQPTAQDNSRFLHYPYVYYPQNFWAEQYYRSSSDMYKRYPPEMRIPSYDKRWMNYYPQQRRYHMGHHFFLDVM